MNVNNFDKLGKEFNLATGVAIEGTTMIID
jgi:hypothetical protein